MLDNSTDSALPVTMPLSMRDVSGRIKVSVHENRYEADFEYGLQPLRWEGFTAGSGAIAASPQLGGVAMTVTTASGDITIRQSRPYHRYQPGKTMYMASAVNFGTTQANQVQRVGFMDDSNGIFFEQTGAPTKANPYGMFAVVRSDASGTVTDTRTSADQWSGDQKTINRIDWSKIQMIWVEFAWYGAGTLRWGVLLNGEPVILHQVGTANSSFTGAAQQGPWARTGNLPVRYEQRNTGTTAASNTMVHYGVSVIVEGGIDPQRGFTYSYGMAPQTPQRAVGSNVIRYPVLSIQPRTMGTQEYTQATTAISASTTTSLTAAGAGWTTNQWQGRSVLFQGTLPAISTGTVSGQTGTITFASAHNLPPNQSIVITGSTPSGWNGTYFFTSTGGSTGTIVFPGTAPVAYVSGATVTSIATARVTSNTATVLTLADTITGGALANAPLVAGTYTIGLINRGQLLPLTLIISASALCVIELIASTSSNPVVLTGQTFTPLSTLGSANSFCTRDVSATAMTGGEVVYAFVAPSGGSGLQTFDLSNFFATYNVINGSRPDILTLAVTTQNGTAANVGAHIICQEAMS